MAPTTWWPFLALLFVAGIFSRTYLIAAFAVMLGAITLMAGWWRRNVLQDLTYQRKFHYLRGFPGETIELRVEVENRKYLPVPWLRVEDSWPAAVGPEDETILRATHTPEYGMLVNLFALRWYERNRRTYGLLLRKRGVYRIGPARLESGDIFGIFEDRREDESYDYLTVFPESVPFGDLRLPSEDPFGDRRARRRLYEDPNRPMGVRDYRPEDEFRRVHWPATAHTGDLQVKVYQPVSAQVLVICLNVSTLPRYWEGTLPGLLEHLVKVTAALVMRGIKDGYRVGLVSNGCLAHADQPFRVPPGRSPAQLAHLLATLAGVTPLVTGAFERFLISEAPRLPYGATLMIVTGLVTPALAEALFRLKQHGRRISLLSFEHKPPPNIPGVNVFHFPYSE